ncbi:MAG TPA: phosphoribosylglycinamide formyltransferase [Polyangiales bacterium]|nr:phosphoribosylglycinamide formyltransferase [Polyangiales bacterium]
MALKLAVLISGTGSNLAAIQSAIAARRCDAEIVLVLSDRPAAGLAFAREHGIRSEIVNPRDFTDRARWDDAIAETIGSAQPDLVVSAGFMRVLGAAPVVRFAGRMINIHPALLPLFPGTRGPELAIEAGMRISGCTVHVVEAGVDTGPIVAQAAVPIRPDDDAATLHARIQRAEHVLLPRVIDAIARGEIALNPKLRHRMSFDASDMFLSPSFRDGSA